MQVFFAYGASEPERESPEEFSEKMQNIGSVLRILEGLGSGIVYWFPTQKERLRQQQIRYALKKLKAEDALYECLASNIFAAKNDNGLPCNCDEAIDLFISAASYEELAEIKKDYKDAAIHATAIQNEQRGSSIFKSIIIGGVIVVGVAVIIIVVAPTGSPEKIVTAVKENVPVIIDTAKFAVEKAKSKVVGVVTNMSTVSRAALVVDGVRIAGEAGYTARGYICPTPEQELIYLKRKKARRKSFVEIVKSDKNV